MRILRFGACLTVATKAVTGESSGWLLRRVRYGSPQFKHVGVFQNQGHLIWTENSWIPDIQDPKLGPPPNFRNFHLGSRFTNACSDVL